MVKRTFHVLQATIDLNTITFKADDVDKSLVQVWTDIDGSHHLIASLSAHMPHVLMNVEFMKGDLISIYTKGSYEIHLTGRFDDNLNNEHQLDGNEFGNFLR